MSFQLLTGETDGFSGSHAATRKPIPVLGSATVCIPIYVLQGKQERGNEVDLHGTARTCGGKPSIVRYALRTLYSFAGFIQ